MRLILLIYMAGIQAAVNIVMCLSLTLILGLVIAVAVLCAKIVES
jgi:hypothetical protein